MLIAIHLAITVAIAIASAICPPSGLIIDKIVSSEIWLEYSDDAAFASKSEEHTSELQSPCNLVCRLLLEKKKKKKNKNKANTLTTPQKTQNKRNPQHQIQEYCTS